MNLNELLSSTNSVGRASQSSIKNNWASLDPYSGNGRNPYRTLKDKTYGSIVSYNSEVLQKGTLNVIEMTMVINSVSDRSSGTHRVTITIGSVPMRKLSINSFIDSFNLPNVDNSAGIANWYNKNHENSSKERAMVNAGGNEILLVKSKLDLSLPVKVSCTCSDYRYTFGYYNWRHGAHAGNKPSVFEDDFEGNGRTIRNVNKSPGLCKHLILFVDKLIADGIFGESNMTTDMGGIKVTNYNEIASDSFDDRGNIIGSREVRLVRSSRGRM